MFEQFVEHDRRPKETAKCLQITEQSTVTNTEDLENLTFFYEKFAFKHEGIKTCKGICKSNVPHYTKI